MNIDTSKLILLLIAAVGVSVFISSVFVFPERKAQAAVVPVYGVISPGSSHASPSYVQDSIKQAKKEGADAFLFQVNSPGGTVVASREIARMIEDVESPTVCQMKDLAASGAYWISSACDEIVADRLSVTGGIGVSASYLEFSEYLKEEGIDYVRLVKGEYKDTGSPYRNLTEEEREFLMDSLQKVYEGFVEAVARNRGMNVSEVRNISTGRTYLGGKARELGLVDHLGGRETVKKILEDRTGKDVEFKRYKEKISLTDLLGLEKKNEMETKLNEISYSVRYSPQKLMVLER